MKTALQGLIERFENYQTIMKLGDEHRKVNISMNLDDVIYLLKESLCIEENQIINAYNNSFIDKDYSMGAVKYYNQYGTEYDFSKNLK